MNSSHQRTLLARKLTDNKLAWNFFCLEEQSSGKKTGCLSRAVKILMAILSSGPFPLPLKNGTFGIWKIVCHLFLLIFCSMNYIYTGTKFPLLNYWRCRRYLNIPSFASSSLDTEKPGLAAKFCVSSTALDEKCSFASLVSNCNNWTSSKSQLSSSVLFI